MSHSSNIRLVDEALEWAEIWTGTLHEAIIRANLNDPEALAEAVAAARTDWYDLEERTIDSEYDEVI